MLVGEFTFDPSKPRTRTILRALQGRLWRNRCDGNYEAMLPSISKYRASEPQRGYDPVSDQLLLELHCAAASAYDHVDQPEQVQSFIGPWASRVHHLIQMQLRDIQTAITQDEPTPTDRAPLAALWQHQDLWTMRAWLVIGMGVQQYHLHAYDLANLYLTDALHLLAALLRASDLQRSSDDSIRPQEQLGNLKSISVYASNLYWRGIVRLYRNEFDASEHDFIEGLQLLATTLTRFDSSASTSGAGEDFGGGVERTHVLKFARYITSRLLMGLGLLRFHQGDLREARSTLLSAGIMLTRDSSDEVRRQRCRSLLSSVERMQLDGNSPDWEQRATELIALSSEIALALRDRNRAHYLRAMRAEALVRLRLADLYMGAGGAKGAKRAREQLMKALQIASTNASSSSTNTREFLQSEVVKLRILTRLHAMAANGLIEKPSQDPVEHGEYLLQHPAMTGLPLVRIATLIALAHALIERQRQRPRKDLTLLSKAQQLLVEARALARHNLQTRLLCSLYLMRIAVMSGKVEEAFNESQKWSVVLDQSAPWIRGIWADIQREIQSGGAARFIIDKKLYEGYGVYQRIDREVRDFLLRQISPGVSRSQLAKRLGISRQSLYAWTAELATNEVRSTDMGAPAELTRSQPKQDGPKIKRKAQSNRSV